MATLNDGRTSTTRLSVRVGPALKLTSHFRRILTRTAADGARRLVGRSADGAEHVDAGQLSRVMGSPVRFAAPIGGTDGTTSRARLSVAGDDLPESVFVKTTARTLAARLLSEFGRLAHSEVLFYRHFASELATGVPRCYGTDFDGYTGRFTIVLEDLAAVDAEFPDTVHPLDSDRAALVVELLARVHGTFWKRVEERRPTDRWALTSAEDPVLPMAGRVLRLAQRRAGAVTSLPVERGDLIFQRYPEVVRAIDQPPHTLLHGDPHPGNCYFLNDSAGLLDWQTARRGHPMRDVAYFLVTGMTSAERQASERDLLDLYRRALAAQGGPELNRDDVWDRYRTGAAHACVAATATAGMGGLQAQDVAYAGLENALNALEDLETVPLLRKII